MKKTIKEWLQELPEPYKGQALQHAHSGHLEREVPNLRQALLCAFSWDSSPEGHKYWQRASKGKYLPYATQTNIPKNALEAIHAIALKEGFKAEEIISINPGNEEGEWFYCLYADYYITINLKNN